MFSILKDAATFVTDLAGYGLSVGTDAMRLSTLNIQSDAIVPGYFSEYLYKEKARSMHRALRKLTKNRWEKNLIQSEYDAAMYKVLAIGVLYEAKGVDKARIEKALNEFEQYCGKHLSPHYLDVLKRRALSLKEVMAYYS